MTTAHPTTIPARELTPDEAEQRASVCFQLDQKIKQGLRSGRESLWTVAEGLYQFSEESGWTALGYDKLTDWLADPEVSVTYRTFRRLVDTWRELVVMRSVGSSTLAEIDPSKVDIVLPAVKSGRVKLDDALADVKTLGARDLREQYIGRRETPPTTPNGQPSDDASDDVIEGRAVPIHDGADEPRWAGDDATTDDDEPLQEPAPEPAHNDEHQTSGQHLVRLSESQRLAIQTALMAWNDALAMSHEDGDVYETVREAGGVLAELVAEYLPIRRL